MWNALRKDTLRFFKDPSALVMGVVIPLVVAIIMKTAFGGDGGTSPKALLLVADHDQSVASALLTGALGQGPLQQLLTVETVAPETAGPELLRERNASALLTLPRGLGGNLLHDRPDTLHLLTNPTQSILPLMVTGILESMADAVFYLQRLLGDDLRPTLEQALESGRAPSLETLRAWVPVVGNRAERVAGLAQSPPLTLKKVTLETENKPTMSVGQVVLPAMLLMGLLFMTQALSADLWQEREQGTLRRLVASASSLEGWLLGKTGAAFVCAGFLGILGLLLASTAFGLEVHHGPLAVVWLAWAGAALFQLFALLQVLASTRRGGGFLASLMVFPLAMLGGSFFPMEIMPEGLAAVGQWTPNGSAIRAMQGLMQSRLEIRTAHVLVVTVVLVLCFAATLSLLRQKLNRGTL